VNSVILVNSVSDVKWPFGIHDTLDYLRGGKRLNSPGRAMMMDERSTR
jgi:hypothetical protein